MNGKNNRLNEDGCVWIENQKVYVKDFRGKGLPPTIIPCENITLIIDGNVCNHIVFVNSKNNIEIKINEEIKEPSISVTFSEDELYAYIRFEPGKKRQFRIKDSDPANSLTIQVQEIVKETFNNITRDRVSQELSKAGVVYGIDQKVIDEIIKADKEKIFTVAKGDMPITGKDAQIEIFFQDGPSKQEPLENEQGVVSYRNLLVFTSVKVKDVITVKHKIEEGKNGMTVTGKPIIPPAPKDLNLVAGRGVAIEENGLIAIAVVSGIPHKTIKDNDIIIEVSELLQINKDIDLSIGNINYDNDILINGTVKETMEVNSLGNVYINGNVTFAKVNALKNITIRGNVISSRVFSGSIRLYGNLLVDLKEIDDMLKLMIQLIEELMRKAAFKIEDIKKKGIGVVIKLLLNSKLKDLPGKIFNLFINVNKSHYGILNGIALEVYESLKVFLGDCTTIKTLEELVKIETAVSKSFDYYIVNTDNNIITINYALNSDISSDGSIKIIGNGCYNTKIHSKTEVYVRGNFIGGEIFAGKLVTLFQVGSDVGAKSLIETPSNGRIIANKIYEGNIIKIGDKTYKFKETENYIDARLVDNSIVLR